MLEIEVCEVRGKCPVHKVGDKIVIDDQKIVLREIDALCTHALSSLLHYVLALEEGADPVKLGLSKPDKIVDCVKLMLRKKNDWENPFGDGQAGKRIIEILRHEFD